MMTHYDVTKLEHLERKTDWKKNYAHSASGNKLLLAPTLLIAIGGLTLFLLNKGRLLQSGYGLLAGFITITGVVLFVIISGRGKKQVLENISQKPVCLAKIIRSNEQQRVHYGIFSTSDTRWDTALLQHISERVGNIASDTSNPDDKTVEQLLHASQGNTNLQTCPLPASFTGGHQIFLKSFDFSVLDEVTCDYIRHRNGIFPVLYVDNSYVPVVLKDYIIA
ncbi:hypothetical protein SAMN04488128_1011585 [Chitinophaga eiseniae]|uniref:Uncharacterized protein n=1 Tax=Chitinophaga eiseniae TaxID=634771 RepID=A0A1T4NHL1_9BACT|nr:hypothetical protein [Chitinophaga eiseniae]SJZ78547.1 hypothetical protein SAMN04488128_1011585 [Chitinophaga eiseniae]